MHGPRGEAVGRGSRALCRVPLKYGGSVAYSWSFMDKKRKTSYILRRHCINACYSCSAFVELIFLSFYLTVVSVSPLSSLALRTFVSFLLYRCLLFFNLVPAARVFFFFFFFFLLLSPSTCTPIYRTRLRNHQRIIR